MVFHEGIWFSNIVKASRSPHHFYGTSNMISTSLYKIINFDHSFQLTKDKYYVFPLGLFNNYYTQGTSPFHRFVSFHRSVCLNVHCRLPIYYLTLRSLFIINVNTYFIQSLEYVIFHDIIKLSIVITLNIITLLLFSYAAIATFQRLLLQLGA